MVSRTADGKHTKRFIIEVKYAAGNGYFRSTNTGTSGFFATKEEAQEALKPEHGYVSEGLTYRIRQK